MIDGLMMMISKTFFIRFMVVFFLALVLLCFGEFMKIPKEVPSK